MKSARFIILSIVVFLFSCAPKKPEIPLLSVPPGPLLAALEQHRLAFSSLKAVASVEIVKRGRKRAFDTVGVAIDSRRRLRVEAYSPMGQALMTIVWDGRDLLLRQAGEEDVVLPGPSGLERIFGEGLEALELSTLLSGNIPDPGGSAVTLLCGQDGGCVLEWRAGDILRRARVSLSGEGAGEGPELLAYEFYRSGKLIFQAQFGEAEVISRYRLPKKIVIEHPDRKMRLTVLYNEVEMNALIRDDVFSLTGQAGIEK